MKIFVVDCTDGSKSKLSVEGLNKKYPEVDFFWITDPKPLPEMVFGNNSILIIYFDTKSIGDAEKSAIQQYKNYFEKFAIVLPIACGVDFALEGELAGIKSLSFKDEKSQENLERRVGAYLGLITIPKDNQIFISYKASDGKVIAAKISSYLTDFGFKVWRDEDRDEDNEGNLICGQDAQENISKALLSSNLVLLIDTAETPSSKWINIEIDLATANLVPIIPLCIRKKDEKAKGSHIRKLRSLNRYIESDETLAFLPQITEEILSFLANVYKRKREVPIYVQRKFFTLGYSWNELEAKRLLYESKKKRRLSLRKILSHFPIYEGIHDIMLNNYIAIVGNSKARYNDHLFIYDGMILTEFEIDEIKKENTSVELTNIILLHHEQIEGYLES